GLRRRYGDDVPPLHATRLLSYSLDAPQFNPLAELADHWLGVPGQSIKELLGTGKAQKTFAEVDIAAAARYACEDADMTFRLWRVLKPRLAAENMTTLY